MKTIAILAAAAMSASAVLADAASARREFVRAQGEVFAHAYACAAEFAPASQRCDLPEGKGRYRFALPYRNDGRVQFVDAEFADGKFVKGELRVFGQKPSALDAKAFADLRAKNSMFSVKTPQEDYNYPACFLPSKDVKFSRNCEAHPMGLGCGVGVLGPLGAVASACGISLKKLRYRVELRESDSFAVPLGVLQADGTVKEDEVYDKVRAALEKRDPKLKGHVSDRDVVDFRARCQFICTPER